MRFRLLSAAITALFLLAACQENSVPEEAQAGDGGQSVTEDQPATGDTGGEPVAGDGDVPSGDQPAPEQDGGAAPVSEDGDFVLPQPAFSRLRYTGPAEDHLHVHVAEYGAVGGEVRSVEDLWRDCYLTRLDERPHWCDDHQLRDSWEDIAGEVERLDEEEYGNRDVFEARSAQWFSGDYADYGELAVGSRIYRLPSAGEISQVSRLVTISTDWTGYPAYLTVVSALPDGVSPVPSGEMAVGTVIRIYGRDDGRDWDGNDKHKRGQSELLVETVLDGGGRYDFRLPADSPYWRMDGPVRFSLEVSQWVSVTRRP